MYFCFAVVFMCNGRMDEGSKKVRNKKWIFCGGRLSFFLGVAVVWVEGKKGLKDEEVNGLITRI